MIAAIATFLVVFAAAVAFVAFVVLFTARLTMSFRKLINIKVLF